jgi:NADH-quinone oxidoreductase subunit L
VAEPLKALLGVEGEPSPTVRELVLSGGLAALALAGTVVLLHRWPEVAGSLERSPLAAWAGLGRLLSPRPAMALARVLATLDDRVVDRAVEGVASAARRTAAGAARLDGGVVDGAVRATAGALRRAGAAARRPQTGLLHQYYAQAAAGLGLLLVLLLVVR